MAEANSKPLVYDLLGRLNAAFARIQRNTQLLEDSGLFEPVTMTRIRNMTEALRANTNSSLLETLQGIEQKDRERYAVRE